MGYFIVADGGGTKTRFCLLSKEKETLYTLESAGTNPVHIGIASSVERICTGIRRIIALSGVNNSDIIAAAVFVPVLWRFKDVLAGKFPFELLCLSDSTAALWAGIGTNDGMTALSGTGSFVTGKYEGNEVLVGGWGSVLGDPGSGYSIGLKAIRHAAEAYDKGIDADAISELVMSHFAINCMDEIKLLQTDRDRINAAAVAALCPLLAEAAEGGNQQAISLLENSAEDMSSQLVICANRLHIPVDKAFNIAITGGAVSNNPAIAAHYIRKIKRDFPKATVFLSKRTPVEGAAEFIINRYIGRPVGAVAGN